MTPSLPSTVVIRPAARADERPLRRLAALDDRAPIAGPGLVAEVDGQLRAARSLRDGRTVADPFHRTAGLVQMLAAANAA